MELEQELIIDREQERVLELPPTTTPSLGSEDQYFKRKTVKERKSTRRHWLLQAFRTLLLSGIGASLVASSSRLRVTHLRHKLGLAKADRVRVAVAADLHFGLPLDFEGIQRELRRLTPDVLLLPGDIIEAGFGVPDVATLGPLELPLGKIATVGNHEIGAYGDEIYRFGTLMESVGVKLLINETLDLGPLRVTGLDDWSGRPEPTVVKESASKGPTLAMTHSPILFDATTRILNPEEASRTLFLAGHTHGGQVNICGIAPYLPSGSGSYVSGWYHSQKSSMYVSRGLGYSYVPFRLGASPELVIIDIS